MPKVSISFPVYNSMPYLRLALDSIVNQNFEDWEMIAIDDGSTDASYELLVEYASRDKRIKVFRNESNKGLSYTRNRIFQLIDLSSEYVALMDADDEAVPERLSVQVKYLDEHQEISACGSNIVIINEASTPLLQRNYPIAPREIRKTCLCANPCANPSMIFRRSVLEKVGGYDEHCVGCEDYDLLLRILQTRQVANLPQYLLRYRISSNQWKQAHLKDSLVSTLRTQRKYLFGHNLFTFRALVRHLMSYPLFLLPDRLVMSLFKALTYHSIR